MFNVYQIYILYAKGFTFMVVLELISFRPVAIMVYDLLEQRKPVV